MNFTPPVDIAPRRQQRVRAWLLRDSGSLWLYAPLRALIGLGLSLAVGAAISALELPLPPGEQAPLGAGRIAHLLLVVPLLECTALVLAAEALRHGLAAELPAVLWSAALVAAIRSLNALYWGPAGYGQLLFVAAAYVAHARHGRWRAARLCGVVHLLSQLLLVLILCLTVPEP